MEDYLVNSEVLANVFSCTEKQIEQFVESGVLTPVNDRKPFQFFLCKTVIQYCNFLAMTAGAMKGLIKIRLNRLDSDGR